MPQIGPAEILVVLLVGLLVFGPKRLPEIGRQVGRAMREVKKFQDTIKGELDQVLHFQDDDDHNDSSADEPAKNELPISTVEVPPALPVPDEPPVTPVRPASHAPSRFRAPGPSSTA
jgi:sec-independent protein translocase protein TatA